MHLVGEARVVLCNEKHSALTTVLVSPNLNHSALIRLQDLQQLRVIPASFPAVAAVASCFTSLRNKTLSAFSLVFSNSLDNKQMCANDLKIFLKPNSIPYHVSSPRPIPLRFQEAANAKIAKHIASGVIVPCDEPTDWCSPAFFVHVWLMTTPNLICLSFAPYIPFRQCQTSSSPFLRQLRTLPS